MEQALVQPYNACSILPNGQRAACQTDRALVNVGMLLLERGNGVELGSRVSTEVDPRMARDEGGWGGGGWMGGQGGFATHQRRRQRRWRRQQHASAALAAC